MDMAVVLGAFVPDTAARWRGLAKRKAAQEMGVAAAARKLADRMEMVGAGLDDAEARAARGDMAASRWLAKVRAAAYQADGAVDRCRVAGRRRRASEPPPQQHQGVRAPSWQWQLSICRDAGEPRGGGVMADLKDVGKKLQEIVKEQRRLQFRASADDHTVLARTVLRHQDSQATDTGIVGAEDVAQRLVHQLTQMDGRQAACEIVAVVGPGGVGKTTLAKLVYKSERVRCSFETRSWVRLSRGYTDAGLLAKVIDAVGGDTTGGESVPALKAELADLVANKRFLLVLDDVRDGGAWEGVLRSPLERGARGSKVLVTAPRGAVAREMGAGHGRVHRVKRLGADDGWTLLRSAACVAGDECSVLKVDGGRIVDKCDGNPLAITVVAGLLRTREASAGEWAEVAASPAWSVTWLPDAAMKPLYLSYDDMPCHLKQCLLYCSLFPPDFAVDRRVLVQQWIAEGLVQIRCDAGVDEVAEQYYDELVGRNLLEPAEKDANGRTVRCTMHAMVHALLQLLSHGECSTNDGAGAGASATARRVALPGRSMTAVPEWILNSEGIRTLLLPMNPLATEGNIFARLHHLKLLDLSETRIELIPETLGDLVYLRFLNLSQTRIQVIPESIGNLLSLKFLLLRECKSLHVLPKGVEHLKGLRDLDLTGTAINDVAFRVGQLRSLTSLRWFAVTSSKEERAAAQDRAGWPLVELKQLSQLRTLHVQKLEKVTDPCEAAEVALAGKTSLRELLLSCSGTVSLLHKPAVVRKIEDIFEELNPPHCLESLKIANYFGKKFPSWLSVIFLPNLRRLDIVGCNFCQSLPPLGLLPELRSLYIADSSATKIADSEFMGADHHHHVPFPKLENLHLKGLQKLEKWVDMEAGAFPSLQALQLEGCPELRCLPGGLRHATSLMELHVVDMARLRAVEDIAALRKLSIWNAPTLNKISSMPALEDLSISHCPGLQIVENVDMLQAVHIFDRQLQEIPRWIEGLATKLHSLDVMSTTKLLKRCLVDGPDWCLIKDIAQVHGFMTAGSSYIYYSKTPYIFNSNVDTERNLDMGGKTSDSDIAKYASARNRNANEDDPVSASDTGFLGIKGFFDSKAPKNGVTRTEGDVTHRNKERSLPRNSRHRMHKLAEVIHEDGEAEGEDPVVFFSPHPTKAGAVMDKFLPSATDDHSDKNDLGLLSKVIPHKPDETDHGAIASSVLTRQRWSKMGKVVPTDPSIYAHTSVIKSAAAVVHNLVREGSPAIDITETDTIFKSSLLRSEEHALNKGDGFADTSKQTGRVHGIARKVETCSSLEEIIPQMVKITPTELVNSNAKDIGDNRTDNGLSPGLANPRQVISTAEKDAHPGTPTRSSNTVNQMHADKIQASASKNAVPTTENETDKQVPTRSSGGVSGSSLISGDHRTDNVTESTEHLNANLLSGEGRSSNERKCVSSTAKDTSCTSADNIDDHVEGNNTSLPANPNHEESGAIGVAETTCDSEPCALAASLASRKQQTVKKHEHEVVSPYPGDDRDASIEKIPAMAGEISEKSSSARKSESAKDPCAETETGRNNTHPLSEPVRAMSGASDTAEAATEAEPTMASRSPTTGHPDGDAPLSMNFKVGESHEAPKVYTAIWADTDTDTLKARVLSSMQQYRRMASSRRPRRRKNCSASRWGVCSVLVAAVLLASVLQLLFMVLIYRKLLNHR